MKPQAQEQVQCAPPTTIRNRLIEVLLISSNDEFIIELGPILGDRYRTRPVENPEVIAAATDASRWISLVDAASLPDARAAVARMVQQHPQAPIIVIATHPKEWSAAVSQGRVLATVARDDLGGPRLIEALSAAEAQLQNEENAGAALTEPQLKARILPVWVDKKRLPLVLTLLAALLLALGGLTWWWLHQPVAAPARVSNSANAGSGTTTGPVATPKAQSALSLLSAARVAFRDQKQLPRPDTELRGDSALEIYTQVLAQEPGNEEATDGVRRLLAGGKAQIQGDLASGKLDDAVRLLGLFKSAGIDADTLRELEAAVAAARPKWLASRAQESINAGDFATAEQLIGQITAAGGDRSISTELHRAMNSKKLDQQLAAMASDVKAAISAGALLDPITDNARTRLQTMRTTSRTHALTLGAQRDVQTALLAHAQEATRKDQFDVAQRFIGAAADINPTAEVADAKRQLQSEMDLVSQRAAAAANAKSRETVVANATAKSSEPHYFAVQLTTPLKIKFPDSAPPNSQGVVTVEFTLHPNGSASDVTVIEATLPGVFDRAATDAVKHGHFDASALVDKQPQRARLRLNFKPN